MIDFTLPIQYARQIADLVQGMGVDMERWLARSDLTPESLKDDSLILPYPVFHRLTVAALEMTQEPALGLLVGERLRTTSHGMLGFAALNSGTLRQVIGLLEAFLHLRFALLSARMEIAGEDVRVHFEVTRPLGEIQAPVLDGLVLTIKNLIGYITMGACQARLVCFVTPEPPYAALARDLFKCEVRYGQPWTGFVLPLESIDRPLTAADPAAFEEAARICRIELDKLKANTSMSARVRRILLDRQSGFPSLPVVARLFNLTPRTLHRRLVEEGTSYMAILEEVRHMLAVQYLRNSQFTIQEIAFNLGYDDPANFRRAFKRWENVPPSEFIARTKDRPPDGMR